MAERIEKLKKQIEKDHIVDMATLFKVLGTNSRMTVFRHLKRIGYLTSYSHSGRYYTIKGIPNFDTSGLWHFRGAWFSKYGNLRTTLVHFAENAEAGVTHGELEKLLHLSVHHTLHDLVRKNSISRKQVDGFYLYISCDTNRASAQLLYRQKMITDERESRSLNHVEIIEVLVDLLHCEDWRLKSVVERLKIRNVRVSGPQVNEVFSRYNIKKKDLHMIDVLRKALSRLQAECGRKVHDLNGVMITIRPDDICCPKCLKEMGVRNSYLRKIVTAKYGNVYARVITLKCNEGCRNLDGSTVLRHPETLSKIAPKGASIGYDIEVEVGLQRYLHYRQREEIREYLRKQDIDISTGKITNLAHSFLRHLSLLHERRSPALKEAIAQSGGYAEHVDATGECGTGTLFVSVDSWRKWVLGAWRLTTSLSRSN